MANEKRILSGARKRKLIIGTVTLLAIAFLILVVLFAAMTSLVPQFTGQCVAVVDINVPLTVEGSPATLVDMGYPGSAEIASSIRELNGRPDVGSVLFVINSGGGSVVATHEIYDAINELEKPKVAYFREVAASGGYYIATPADYIISEPMALTGNIGVIATSISMKELLDKIGVNATVITSGDHKAMGSPFKEMTPEEQEILQSIVDEIYQDFRSIVIEQRGGKLNRMKFEEVTDARILTGKQALEVGLVDDVGNQRDALMKAAELGDMEAEKPEDVRTCYISINAVEGGLFTAESFIKPLEETMQRVSLKYQ